MLIKLDKKCRKCGRDISNQEYEEHNGYCAMCKEKLISNKKKRIRMDKKGKKKILCIIIGSIILIPIIIYIFIMCTYELGIINYKAGKYKEAIKYFERVSQYKDSREKKSEMYYLSGIEERKKENFDESLLYFEKANNYSDTEEQIKETKYQQAIKLYKMGEFEKAKQKLNELGDYKEVTKIINEIEIMLKYQGIWFTNFSAGGNIEYWNGKKLELTQDSYMIIIINGWNMDTYIFSDIPVIKYNEFKIKNAKYCRIYEDNIKLEEENIRVYAKDTGKEATTYFEMQNDFLVSKLVETNATYQIYARYNNDANSLKIEELEKPRIGMTKTEVKNSTWGKPTKINKTTTSYGVHEQWCYSNYKYIYFENGVVTSIQE